MPRGIYSRGDPVARFWSKVNKDGPTAPHMLTPCWVWTAGTFTGGYGKVKWGGRNRGAHVVAWMLTNGPIPPGEGYHGTCVLHECDNKPCVRPDHLHHGPVELNNAEMVARGRQARGEDHYGAKLTEADVLAIREAPGTLRELSARFGVSPVNVSLIRRGRTWKHVAAEKNQPSMGE